jgi:hypothetical protein
LSTFSQLLSIRILHKSTRTIISIIFFLIQSVYVKYFFTWLYDNVTFSWPKMRLLFWSIFKRGKCEKYTLETSEIQAEILKVVNEIGSKIIKNFEENRIIKEKNERRVWKFASFNNAKYNHLLICSKDNYILN